MQDAGREKWQRLRRSGDFGGDAPHKAKIKVKHAVRPAGFGGGAAGVRFARIGQIDAPFRRNQMLAAILES